MSVVEGMLGAMTRMRVCVRDDAVLAAYAGVADMADWSDWLPFGAGAGVAESPRLPGVYLFREPETHVTGTSAWRASGPRVDGRRVSTADDRSTDREGGVEWKFGEAALDRALADPEWVHGQLERLRSEGPRRANLGAADAIARAAPEISWASC